MKPFLEQVARHYHPSEDLGRVCFIFPNKRAVSFFKKYLGTVCAENGKACFAPVCLTVNDFFASLSGLRPVDRIAALTYLYDCYRELYPGAESLDDFIFWGGVLLGDFSEVDKYLVNPEHIFRNVSEFRQMQDDMAYLEPGQREAMEHFLRQFDRTGDYKERFRRIWDILLPLYRSFNKVLAGKGLASEGAIYRSIASRLDSEAVSDILASNFPNIRRYVFAGLNALNECEKKVMRRMRDAGLAEFCWDYSSKEIRDPANRSSFFLSRNVAEFPQAFIPDPEGLPRPVVEVISCPSSVGQVKLLPSILGNIGSPGIDTAIVLPDEGLLLNTLNSIPESIKDINVTMGYPMNGSGFSALLEDIAAMQVNLRDKDGEALFYHRYVWGIFSNGILRNVLDDKGKGIVAGIRREARYYIPEKSFRDGGILGLIFRKAADPAVYMRELLSGLAALLRDHGQMQMELSFAMFAYKAATRLQGLDLKIQPRTWWRLFGQLISRASVPFSGEPLKGLQIMGPLETRALDFDNVIILSCNEGIFPRRAVAPSFIPAELRKGFGLPTYEYQDSVWAYYFYRLIQRAGKVWLVFDSRTELSRSGEESRYIRQLQMLYGADVRRSVVKAPLREATEDGTIPKTDEDIAVMHGDDFHLSASSIKQYLDCPASFYYSKIKGLSAADEVNEALDSGMMGTVLHETMQTLYSGRKTISRGYLRDLLGSEDSIRGIIGQLIMKKLRADEVQGRNLIFEDLILKYVMQILKTDLGHLEKCGRDGFSILGLELKRKKRIGNFKWKGTIDRLDSFEPGVVRVVDYKTGNVLDSDIDVNDANAERTADAIFGNDNSKRPEIALQLFLYDELIEEDAGKEGLAIENCIYKTRDLYLQAPRSVPVSSEFRRLVRERLSGLMDELDNPDIPWSRTEDTGTCEYCDFKTICGR